MTSNETTKMTTKVSTHMETAQKIGYVIPKHFPTNWQPFQTLVSHNNKVYWYRFIGRTKKFIKMEYYMFSLSLKDKKYYNINGYNATWTHSNTPKKKINKDDISEYIIMNLCINSTDYFKALLRPDLKIYPLKKNYVKKTKIRIDYFNINQYHSQCNIFNKNKEKNDKNKEIINVLILKQILNLPIK